MAPSYARDFSTSEVIHLMCFWKLRIEYLCCGVCNKSSVTIVDFSGLSQQHTSKSSRSEIVALRKIVGVFHICVFCGVLCLLNLGISINRPGYMLSSMEKS